MKNSLDFQSLARILWESLTQPRFMWLAMFISAFFLMLIVGSPLIRWLKNLRDMKWSAREDTPDTHLQKHGTPSMGGIGIIGSAIFTFASVIGVIVFLNGYSENNTPIGGRMFWLELLSLLLLPWLVAVHAILGFMDDRSKATGRGGLSARAKFFNQCLLAAIFLWAISVDMNPTSHKLGVLVMGHDIIIFYGLFIGLAILLVGVCNAVNITDGIDGLAAGLCVQIGVAFALTLTANDRASADVALWGALAGACFGFLFFNRYPAKVFMGDTGSLALGAALGGAAILTRTVFLLPFIGFIFFIELFSVTAQVLYFKYTRKTRGEGVRLFRRAPLHHHFELGGWSEWRVVATFWTVNLITSVIGLILWKNNILPRFP